MKKTQMPKTNSFESQFGKIPILLALIATTLTFALPASAEQCGIGRDQRNIGKGDVDVMTVNLYVGGDIGRVLAINPADANYIQELISAVTGVYNEILVSAPQVRLQAVANQIADRLPDIVAVEEASLIRVQSPGDLVVGGSSPATNVVFDYLQILINDLRARGAHYKVVSVANEVDVELPMLNLQNGGIDDARLSDREAILVRTDLPPSQLLVLRQHNGSFVNVIPIPSLGLSVKRGWCSVDVLVRGKYFRCVCTHLEQETAPQLQALQVQELLAGPAKTTLPVIILGDFNADPLHRDGSFAYDLMPAAGFSDAWAKLHASTPAGGLTWGHDEYLADPTAPFDRRIDFVFYRGKDLTPTKTDVVDMPTGLKTQPPLWASDHAAVQTTFKFSNNAGKSSIPQMED